jgi:hypothetical protein
LILIKNAGATDVILVPTSKNIDQLRLAAEAVSQYSSKNIFNKN